MSKKLVEMIQLEAVRRLRHGSGLDDAEINSLGIFPSLRESNRSGLIWYSSQRYEHPFHFLWMLWIFIFPNTSDFLWWPGSQISDLNPVRTNFVDHSLQIHENVLKDARSFCPNLNCIQTHCSIHSMFIISVLSFQPFFYGSLPIPDVDTNEIYPPKALITNGAMMSNLENRCGHFCYRDEKYFTPAGTVILNLSLLRVFAYKYVYRKMNTGAVTSDQKWRAFSNLCQILVRVIWLLSVVNRVSRYIASRVLLHVHLNFKPDLHPPQSRIFR